MIALGVALATGDDAALQAGLIGSDTDVAAFGRAVGELVGAPDPPVAALEALLDGWAAGPEEVLACAAVAAYGEVGAVRPDWIEDELRKLRHAAADPRPRVREAAAAALARLNAGK